MPDADFNLVLHVPIILPQPIRRPEGYLMNWWNKKKYAE